MKRNLLLCLSILSLISCKKVEEIIPKKEKPTEETFTVKYYFINQGDANIRNVVLWTTTVFPKYSSVSYFDKAFNGISATDTLVKVIDGPYAHPATVGCTTQMKIAVIFNEPVYSKFPDYNLNNGRASSKTFISKQDTIRSAADAIVTFKWPVDTLHFEQIRY